MVLYGIGNIDPLRFMRSLKDIVLHITDVKGVNKHEKIRIKCVCTQDER